MQQKFLEFIVDDQFIRAPHYTVVADSRDYLVARFTFSEHWQGLTKTAVFQGADGKAYFVVLDKDTCPIPWEVIQPTRFLVSVFGGDRLTADRAMVEVAASGFTANGVTPPAPTPDVYNQVMEAVSLDRQLAENAATTATEKAEQCVYLTSSAESLLQDAMHVHEIASAAREAEQHALMHATLASEKAEQTTAAKEAAKASEDAANRYATNASVFSEEARAAADEAKTAADSAKAAVETAKNEWKLLQTVNVTETTPTLSYSFANLGVKEVYFEGVIYTADKTELSQGFTIGTNSGSTLWNGNANFGNQTYPGVLARAHIFLSPGGTMVCNATISFFGYMLDSSGKSFTTTGRFTESSFTNRTAINGLFLKITGGFAEGTTFKIWGR